ncbi:hypothetical protein PIB30_039861 [Stylosanthes scabra]|uniref:Uncharacterized protein n=1 Tax=Stylosanthes scabra TaxID=79078 RepID=A0ABU6UHN2_9FABA|nr:hypothetical protein [Stylosanthes scabra]
MGHLVNPNLHLNHSCLSSTTPTLITLFLTQRTVAATTLQTTTISNTTNFHSPPSVQYTHHPSSSPCLSTPAPHLVYSSLTAKWASFEKRLRVEEEGSESEEGSEDATEENSSDESTSGDSSEDA